MAGTKAGGRKAAETNRKKDPEYYKRIGSKGGSKETEKTKYRGYGRRKLKSYPLRYEKVEPEIPEPVRKKPGRKPKHPRTNPDNVLENAE